MMDISQYPAIKNWEMDHGPNVFYLPEYICISFSVPISPYPVKNQGKYCCAKSYPVIPMGIGDFSKSAPASALGSK